MFWEANHKASLEKVDSKTMQPVTTIECMSAVMTKNRRIPQIITSKPEATRQVAAYLPVAWAGGQKGSGHDG